MNDIMSNTVNATAEHSMQAKYVQKFVLKKRRNDFFRELHN